MFHNNWFLFESHVFLVAKDLEILISTIWREFDFETAPESVEWLIMTKIKMAKIGMKDVIMAGPVVSLNHWKWLQRDPFDELAFISRIFVFHRCSSIKSCHNTLLAFLLIVLNLLALFALAINTASFVEK